MFGIMSNFGDSVVHTSFFSVTAPTFPNSSHALTYSLTHSNTLHNTSPNNVHMHTSLTLNSLDSGSRDHTHLHLWKNQKMIQFFICFCGSKCLPNSERGRQWDWHLNCKCMSTVPLHSIPESCQDLCFMTRLFFNLTGFPLIWVDSTLG